MMTMMKLLSLVFCAMLPLASKAQIEGTDYCACNPRVYELTLDFSKTCEPIELDLERGGVIDATCLATGFDNVETDDTVPVSVSSIQFVEIGMDGSPAAVAQETGEFLDGATVSYTSISSEGAVAPRALQVRMLGANAAGVPLVLQWAITFSNNCAVFPTLYLNDSIGWTVFTDLEHPLDQVCPDVSLCMERSVNCTYPTRPEGLTDGVTAPSPPPTDPEQVTNAAPTDPDQAADANGGEIDDQEEVVSTNAPTTTFDPIPSASPIVGGQTLLGFGFGLLALLGQQLH